MNKMMKTLLVIVACCLHANLAIPFANKSAEAKLAESLRKEIQEELKRDPGTPVIKEDEYKSGWCVTKKMNITISDKDPNCVSREVESNICWGQCNSLFIPFKPHPIQLCYECSGADIAHKRFRLECPGTKKGFKMVKRAVIVGCKCQRCRRQTVYERVVYKDRPN